jgi:hypothetical protein
MWGHRRFETKYWRGATSQKDVKIRYNDTELNKESNARMNVILRRARLTVVVVEMQKVLNILSVSVALG